MHRTHLPLTLWFWAIYLCATDKRGISAVQLSRTLGICYDSAWHLLDRIRTAMGQRDEKYLLSGIVELDDGYVGGPSHNGKRGRGTDKAKIVVAVSKTANSAPLFARMKAVDNVQGKTLQELSYIIQLSPQAIPPDRGQRFPVCAVPGLHLSPLIKAQSSPRQTGSMAVENGQDFRRGAGS